MFSDFPLGLEGRFAVSLHLLAVIQPSGEFHFPPTLFLNRKLHFIKLQLSKFKTKIFLNLYIY